MVFVNIFNNRKDKSYSLEDQYILIVVVNSVYDVILIHIIICIRIRFYIIKLLMNKKHNY